MDKIKKKLSLVPNTPGCYQMKDKDGNIIYVGKAKKLKNRLSSYFRGNHYGKTAKLVSQIDDFDFILVNSEAESLILENNLIKKYNPKYNILLRDDKTYPYIELTCDDIPKLQVIRNINLKKHKEHLYGPYPNVSAAREVVNLLNRLYPLRKCNTFEKKPCLYYHLNQCLGYCTNNIDKNKVIELKNSIIKFLKGDASEVIKKLESEMYLKSSELKFEEAKELKDKLEYIKYILEKQDVEISSNLDIDVFGHYIYHGYLSIIVLFIRGGKLLGKHNFIKPLIDDIDSELTTYIAHFYDKDLIKPNSIIIPPIIDKNLLNNYLNIEVITPIKGEKKKLLDMAILNSKIKLEEEMNLIEKDEKRTSLANLELKNILKLDKLDRIEIFDNSNLFGTFNVSGMVVFIDGVKAKDEYRKFKITNNKNDDYNTMREVIARRYTKVLNENLDKPDLIIVDGALGQINVAKEVLKEINLNIKVVGLKKDDKHNTNALVDDIEIPIDKKSNLFHYLTIMQDEVHNFTINYHKQIRSKGALSSILDNIEGIGEKRKNILLKKYKTLNKMKEATILELKEILPNDIAVNLKEFLDNYKI